MASKRHLRRKAERGCRGKQSHNTEAEAIAHKYSHLKTFQDQRILLVYKCKLCKKWHIGHGKRLIKKSLAGD